MSGDDDALASDVADVCRAALAILTATREGDSWTAFDIAHELPPRQRLAVIAFLAQTLARILDELGEVGTELLRVVALNVAREL